MNNIFSLLSAFILSVILTPLFKSVASQFKILDQPGKNKIHTRPTPLLGGLVIYLSFVIVVLISTEEFSVMHKTLLVAGTIIFIFGLIDDIKPLSAVLRLGVQIVATFLLIQAGTFFTFLPDTVLGKTTEIILTFVWVVGITNAFNYLDGLNGLAVGVTIIGAAFFFTFAIITGQTVLAYLLATFIGACAGFFPYNFFKGKIFLGNSGSMWIGFMMAGLAIIGDWAPNDPIDLIIPVLIFGIPIFDMILTSISRIHNGKIEGVVELLKYRGEDHIHHRLCRLGLGKKKTVIFIYLASVVLSLCALLLQLSHSSASMVIIMSMTILFFVLISLLVVGQRTNIK